MLRLFKGLQSSRFVHHKAVQPIARQIMEGVQQLHDFGIARGTYEGSKGRRVGWTRGWWEVGFFMDIVMTWVTWWHGDDWRQWIHQRDSEGNTQTIVVKGKGGKVNVDTYFGELATGTQNHWKKNIFLSVVLRCIVTCPWRTCLFPQLKAPCWNGTA